MTKKLLVTLDINYNKNISSLTRPYLEKYAEKIGADLKIINERKFIDSPINMEKFQVYEMSKDYDWTIFIDSDALIHPNCPDMTELFGKDTVTFYGIDYYPTRYKTNSYTRRDGRNIAATTWLTVFSDWTRDLWKPYKNPIQYVDQIDLMDIELNFGYESKHILDDYLVSRNIAKYGLKVKTIKYHILNEFPQTRLSYFVNHEYCKTDDDKVIQIQRWIDQMHTNTIKSYRKIDGVIINETQIMNMISNFEDGKMEFEIT